MPFTVSDFQDLLRLLKEKPEWGEELRRAVLTEELLELPRLMRELAAEVRALAEAQRRAEERLSALEARVDRLERALVDLAEAQRRTEAELQELAKQQRQMRETQDRFAQVIGPAVEARMVAAIQDWLRQRGYRLLQPVASVPLDGVGEVDGLTRAVSPEGQEVWLLVSVKAKVWPRDVKEFSTLLTFSTTQAALKEFGVTGAVLPVVFGMVMDYRTPAAASEARVGLILEAQGEIVPPQEWVIEEAN